MPMFNYNKYKKYLILKDTIVKFLNIIYYFKSKIINKLSKKKC